MIKVHCIAVLKDSRVRWGFYFEIWLTIKSAEGFLNSHKRKLFIHDYPLSLVLTGKALCSGNQWYFFSQVMENRVSENGYWKDLNFELPIFSSAGKKIGVKKHFSFFTGEAPSGVEIGWNLQEYHLCNFAFNYSSFKRKRNRKLVSKLSNVCIFINSNFSLIPHSNCKKKNSNV